MVDEEEELQPTLQTTTLRRFNLKNPIDTRGLLTKIKSTLYISMNHYWKDLTKPDALLSSLLDPRMKDLSIVSSNESDNTKNLLHEKYNEMKLEIGNTQSQQSSTSQSTTIHQLAKSPTKNKKKKKSYYISWFKKTSFTSS